MPKLDRRGVIEGTIIILFVSLVLSLYNNYSNFGFAQSKCSSTSKSPAWINIARTDKSEGYNIIDVNQNNTILKRVPRLADAITIADAIHEKLKPFTNSPITPLPVSPTSNVIITDKDTSILLDSIPFNRSSSVDREGTTVDDFKAYLSHKNKVYLVHVFEIKCAR